MEFFKFIMCAVVFAVVILVVKNQEKEIGILLSLACSIILAWSIFGSAVSLIAEITTVFETANLDTSMLSGVLKIVGIAYITEFAGNICEESGSQALASKVRIFGKITVLFQTVPLISNFVSIIGGLL